MFASDSLQIVLMPFRTAELGCVSCLSVALSRREESVCSALASGEYSAAAVIDRSHQPPLQRICIREYAHVMAARLRRFDSGRVAAALRTSWLHTLAQQAGHRGRFANTALVLTRILQSCRQCKRHLLTSWHMRDSFRIARPAAARRARAQGACAQDRLQEQASVNACTLQESFELYTFCPSLLAAA